MRRACAVLAILAAQSSCSEDDPPRLDLVVRASEDGAGVKRLVVFLRVGEGEDRAVGAEVFDLEAAGVDLAVAPLELGLRAPSRFSGSVSVHVVGCTGAARCRDDPVQAPDCSCDGAIAFGVARVAVSGTTTGSVDLVPLGEGCDKDGDLFPACTRGGAPTGCCERLPPDQLGVADDCHDEPQNAACRGRGCDTRAAHPFKPVERDGEASAGDVQVARHRAWCGDGLINDCLGDLDTECLQVDSDGDGVGDDLDCAPQDPDRFPNNAEVCGDGVDQDCNDFDPPCDADGDGFIAEQDCDDNDPSVHPGAAEVCGDGVDQDCNQVDLLCLSPDLDGDGYDCPFVNPWDSHACAAPGLDCNDLDAGIHPGASERCGDGIDQDCDGVDQACQAGDLDGDGQVGVASGGTDCDDADPWVYAGAADKCGDGIDQDCDGSDASCDQDEDGDGWNVRDDCEDENARVHPGATEICNGRDDDCDGTSDEGNPLQADGQPSRQQPCGDACPEGGPPCSCRVAPWVCTERSPDQMAGGASEIVCLGVFVGELTEACNGFDDDCDAVLDEDNQRPCYTPPNATENVGICHGGIETCNAAPAAGAASYGVCEGEVVPEPDETCDAEDDDCDGLVDNRDPAGNPVLRECFPYDPPAMPGNGPCRRGTRTCENGSFAACVGATGPDNETCDNVDQDCDGTTDEGLNRSCYTPPQATRDVGSCRSGSQTCAAGEWQACRGQQGPVDEVCDANDNDCDGTVDEGVLNACGRCGRVPGEVCDNQDNDCDGRTDEGVQNACGRCGDVPREVCNNVDDDCDGTVDEGVRNACNACGAVPVEACDNQDNDCDGRTDEGVQNACGRCGGVPAEICNGADDDCDGATDEGLLNACGACGAVPVEVCDRQDNDCDGATDEGVANACGGCGDVEPEVCNGADDDCDGETDEGRVGVDVANCGRCGNACDATRADRCSANQVCSCGDLGRPCGGRSDNCAMGQCKCGAEPECAMGMVCTNGACVMP